MPRLRLIALSPIVAAALATPASGATLIADYRFDDSRTSAVSGAPALADIGSGNAFATETVNGQPNRVLTFPGDNGLHLPNTDGFFTSYAKRVDEYSVVMRLRLAAVNGYRRLLNFRDPAVSPTEDGLYVLNSRANFYDAVAGAGGIGGSYSGTNTPFAPNVFVELAFVRYWGLPDTVQVFVNGTLELNRPDNYDVGQVTAEGLRFFKDDGSEHSAGAVARIRVYDGALTQQEVSALANQTDPPPPDGDGDGLFDYEDNCPAIINANQANFDSDGLGDACDDSDGDGVVDASDNCRSVANGNQADLDADAQGDACDDDEDGDGVVDAVDNCPSAGNLDQQNADGDGEGNACDIDDDGDGVLDTVDKCPYSGDTGQRDFDSDGLGDACDGDDDGDGVVDTADGCPLVAQADDDGCPAAQIQRSGKVRTRRAGKKGITVISGFRAVCPVTPVTCPVKGSVAPAKPGGSSAALRTLGVVTMRLQPGATRPVTIKLTDRGATALRKAGQMRVKIKVSATGPDGKAVRVTRTVKIRRPR